MKPVLKLTGIDQSAKILKNIADLSKLQVYVGVPEEKAGRRKQGVNNAELMFIHTRGSPLRNIPARPVMEPAIENNKNTIAAPLKAAGKAALESNRGETITFLKRAGLTAQNIARAWFTDPRNNWAPNSPRTIRRKKSDRPLIDTGQLRKSITFVVVNER